MASRAAPDKGDSEAQSNSLTDSFHIREEISRIFGTFSLMPIRQALAAASLYQNFENTTTLSAELIGPLFDSMMEVFYFECFLESVRKSWMVQSGKGSQEWGTDGYKSHISLAEKIIEIGKERIEYYNREG